MYGEGYALPQVHGSQSRFARFAPASDVVFVLIRSMQTYQAFGS